MKFAVSYFLLLSRLALPAVVPTVDPLTACANLLLNRSDPSQDLSESLKATVDLYPEQIALLDAAGTILYVNTAWREFGESNGQATPYGVGANYGLLCESAWNQGPKEAQIAVGIRDLLEGKTTSFNATYRCRDRMCQMHAAKLSDTRVKFLISHSEAKILVVEDNELVMKVTTRILEGAGYRVITANSVAKALTIYKENPSFYLILTDYKMPEMTGLDLIREIRQMPSSVSILVMSGFSDGLGEEDFIQTGALGLLVKPFGHDALLNRIEDLGSSG